MPVAQHPGGWYVTHGYYTEGYITESNGRGTLTVEPGGGRTYWSIQLSNWGPGGNVLLGWQGMLGAHGLLGENAYPRQVGVDLTLARPTCTEASDCYVAFGETGAECVEGFCEPGFVNRTRSDWVHSNAYGDVDAGCSATDPAGPTCWGHSLDDEPREDDAGPGFQYYGATIVIDVPPDAKGWYSLGWRRDLTYFIEQPPTTIPFAEFIPGYLEIEIGMCCYGISTPSAGCVDAATRDECAALPQWSSWDRGQICDNPPGPDGCVDHCDTYPPFFECDWIDDACLDSMCVGMCVYSPKEGWDPEIACCNGSDGSVDPLVSPSECLVPSCSRIYSRGDLVLTPLPPGTPCSVEDPCLKAGLCDATGECICGPEDGAPCFKQRYIAMEPIDMGGPTAIRVGLTSLHHPPVPPPGTPDFTAWEGEYRWVNSLNETHTCPDSPVFGTTFRCATLSCEPEYRNWAGELGGDVLQVTGAAVVPSSEYTVTQLASSCMGNEESCTDLSEDVSIFTGAHGDVGPVDPLLVLDVARVVDHLKGMPGCPSKPRVQLQPNVPDALGQNVSVLDLATAVDALKNKPYGFAGPFGPCTDACPGEAACP